MCRYIAYCTWQTCLNGTKTLVLTFKIESFDSFYITLPWPEILLYMAVAVFLSILIQSLVKEQSRKHLSTFKWSIPTYRCNKNTILTKMKTLKSQLPIILLSSRHSAPFHLSINSPIKFLPTTLFILFILHCSINWLCWLMRQKHIQ